MKLERVRVAQLRQFREPFELTDLDEGINLLVGPNESGKSTLVDAIRAAFLERHRSNGVANLQPGGDSGAAPQIELAFVWQGQHWSLHKRFLKQPRCDLDVDGETYNGTEAEDKLAELFGFAFAQKGGSRAELQGIPGLLWVTQGDVQEIRQPLAHASQQLQAALSGHLSKIASSAGDGVIAAVEKVRSELLTRTGQPTGAYKEAIRASGELTEQLDGLDTQVAAFQQQVDRLGKLLAEQRDIDGARPWEAEKGKAAAAEARLREVEAWQVEQARDRQTLTSDEAQRKLYQRQLDDFERDQQTLGVRSHEKDLAKADLDSLNAATAALEGANADAKATYDAAIAEAELARLYAERQAKQREHQDLTSAVTAERNAITQARELQESINAIVQRERDVAIDPDGLDELREVQTELRALEAQERTIATGLEFSLEPAREVQLNDETLAGSGHRLLLEPAQIRVPGVGTLTLQPGGADVAKLARGIQSQESARQNLLRRLGIADLAAGEQRARDAERLADRLEQQRGFLAQLAPDGLEVLVARAKDDAARLGQLTRDLDTLPPFEGEPPDEGVAKESLDAANAGLAASERALVNHGQAIAVAEQKWATAVAEWQRLDARIHSAERAADEQDAHRRLAEIDRETQALGLALQERQERIDAAQPEVLKQDQERHTRSASAMEAAAKNRQLEIAQLQGALQSLSARGLEEERGRLQSNAYEIEQRRRELERRAKALDLLLDRLRAKRELMTQTLLAPVQERVQHYLRLLFPGATLQVGEDLVPTVLNRQPAGRVKRDELDALSFGTKEQLGLISRLAYADLLRDAGKPTLVILDDALVNTDAMRLNQMKRVLYDAAERHQILLFSCHPEWWDDLGVAARELRNASTTEVVA